MSAEDIAQRIADARLLIVADSIDDAFVHYGLVHGFDASNATDEQRAEFLAHVAHTIGYDIHDKHPTDTGSITNGFLFGIAYDKQQRDAVQWDRDGN